MIPPRVALGVNRVITKFVDVGGVSQKISGSGFWLEGEPDGTHFFITNRHNVDPRLDRDLKHWKTESIWIELRADPDDDVQVREFEIANLDRSLFVSKAADCAVFAAPLLEGCAPPFQVWMLGKEYDLAGEDSEAWRWLDIGDMATFIGFAGRGASRWWDQKRSLPIGRLASLSSYPGASFEHDDISTADTALVSGLSFSGASGSPVISHVKTDVSDGFSSGHFNNRVDSEIIGIMSGHFWDHDESAPPLFQHSGLSYFTRATSIRALIEHARTYGFVNANPHPFLIRRDV